MFRQPAAMPRPLDVALAQAADNAAAKAADRQAARLGGAAARVMGNVRLALRTLGGMPATAEEGEWIGVRFEDKPACSPAEAEQRLAAARAAAGSRPDAGAGVTEAQPASAAAPDHFAAALARIALPCETQSQPALVGRSSRADGRLCQSCSACLLHGVLPAIPPSGSSGRPTNGRAGRDLSFHGAHVRSGFGTHAWPHPSTCGLGRLAA